MMYMNDFLKGFEGLYDGLQKEITGSLGFVILQMEFTTPPFGKTFK